MSTDRLITIASVVLGVLVSWNFYNLSLPTRIPSFLIDPVRAVLADGSPDISIQYKGKLIGQKAGNVVRVYFWNAGNTPITEEEIREPLTIVISGSEILDTKTLKVSPDTLITFDAQNDQRNTANVNFKLLESNDGAALQITYAGPKDAKLEFHGATIGARSPVEITIGDYSQKIFDRLSPLEKVVSRNEYVFSFLFVVLVLSVLSMIFIPFVRNFIYRRIFRSNKTNPEIEDSAMRLLFPLMLVLFLLGCSLIHAIPPEVAGAIPPALIVKDLIL